MHLSVPKVCYREQCLYPEDLTPKGKEWVFEERATNRRLTPKFLKVVHREIAMGGKRSTYSVAVKFKGIAEFV